MTPSSQRCGGCGRPLNLLSQEWSGEEQRKVEPVRVGELVFALSVIIIGFGFIIMFLFFAPNVIHDLSNPNISYEVEHGSLGVIFIMVPLALFFGLIALLFRLARKDQPGVDP